MSTRAIASSDSGVRDALCGFYSGLRRVNAGLLLEQAVDHWTHSLALGARIRGSDSLIRMINRWI